MINKSKVTFEFSEVNSDELHELLCLAIFEQSVDALEKLTDIMIDIRN